MKAPRLFPLGLVFLSAVLSPFETAQGRVPPYIRGDANATGDVDISDASFLLNYLFSGGNAPSCIATADANKSGDLDISDAISILSFLFLGTAELPPLTAEEEQSCPKPWVVRSGEIVTEMHEVTGHVEQLSNRTIRITHFNYDGGGGDGVFIWLNNGGDLRRGHAIGDDLQIGRPYTDATIEGDIPSAISDDMFHAVSIWCTTFDTNFGTAQLAGTQ